MRKMIPFQFFNNNKKKFKLDKQKLFFLGGLPPFFSLSALEWPSTGELWGNNSGLEVIVNRRPVDALIALVVCTACLILFQPPFPFPAFKPVPEASMFLLFLFTARTHTIFSSPFPNILVCFFKIECTKQRQNTITQCL